MKIIIAGASDVGLHLAKLLSYESQDITLIDSVKEQLTYAETHLDIRTIHGDPSALAVLKKACLLYTSPSPRDRQKSRMPSSA